MSGKIADFPGRYPVLLEKLDASDGRAFAVDTSYEQFRRQSFHHDTIPAQRDSLAITDVPGEGMLNPESLWRRGQISWHHGAGQLYADRKESDPYRFYASLGIDPWNQDQLTLLPATTLRVDDSAGTYNTAKVVVVNGAVWTLETTIPAATGPYSYRLRYSDDWGTWTVPSGIPANNISDMATDGANIYISGFYGSGTGVWVASPSGTGWGAFTQIINTSVERIFYCGDRLFAAYGPDLYDISAVSGAAQALTNGVLIMAHVNSNWHWGDMTAGESFIYASGQVILATETLEQADLGESAVYQFSTSSGIGGLTSGVNLTSGLIAYKPPFGEIVTAIHAYANYVFIGTIQGVRCARTVSLYDPSGNAGDLIAGPLIPNQTQPFNTLFTPFTNQAVYGFVGFGRFVWFFWPGFTYGGTSYNGLGRLDLGNFLADLQPAYASDIMVPSSVISSDLERGCVFWDPVSNGPGFVIPGGTTTSGIYTIDYNVSLSNAVKYVTTGYMRTGLITYGMQDNKTVAQANLKSGSVNLYAPFDSTGGSITLDVSYDRGAFAALTPLAPNQQANPPTLVSTLTQAEEIEVEAILTAGSSNATRPFLNRWTIKSIPNVVSGQLIFVALDLYGRNQMDDNGMDFSDPYGDYGWLINLYLAQDVLTYKEAPGTAGSTAFTATCVINEMYWMPQQRRNTADGGYAGVLVVTLKTIVG